MLERVRDLLGPFRTNTSPFAEPPSEIGGRWSGGKTTRFFWVRPELVCQVKFASWT
jgi:hypothetical protein